MNCSECRAHLHAYLDQELDLPSVVAIDQHLAACAECKALFAGHLALRSGIRRHAEYHEAPSALAARIRERIASGAAQAPAAPRKRAWRWPDLGQWLPAGVAAAAAAVISWSVAVQYASVSPEQMLAEQVISSHARSLITSRMVEVASSDQHTVKPWLSSKLDFSPPVPDLAGAGFPLAGGRLDYIDRRPVAALVYRYRQHVISLFVWPGAKPGRGAETFEKNGYNVVRWSEAGMSYWAISDVNPAELKAFTELYASAK